MNRKYQYKETGNYDILNISILIDKYDESNQDEVFNKVILIISKLETNITLSESSAVTINKFLGLATHNRNLDIRKFLDNA